MMNFVAMHIVCAETVLIWTSTEASSTFVLLIIPSVWQCVKAQLESVGLVMVTYVSYIIHRVH